ncbi:MAG: NACHT domain-containing protein [Symploca sp. SIO2D2]|nr:NACHT domain-containing protein [Symploca sp. SIO2D2]
MYNAVRLTLGIEQQNYRVERPFSATVVQQSLSPEPLAAGTRIIEVFNRPELNRQLLILGEPGAGKTTMMLELAEDLLRRAIANETEPIPVLLNLSSWKNPEQSIFDWLLGELKEKYGIRQDLAGQWLKENQLLPLLDGLDEVAPQYQQACAIKLNDWLIGELQQRSCGVLICCRREEFEQVVQQPLSLYGAIYVQPLTLEQIEDYLTQFRLQDVWQTVQQDKALQEILTKPLFWSMFGLVQTQGKFSLSDWQSRSTSEDKIEYLLDTYWEAAMIRELIINPNEKQQGIYSTTYGKKLVPTHQAVQRVLVFAAKMLRRESSTELLIEKMQPDALITQRQKWAYRLIFGLVYGLIFALIYWLAYGLIFGMAYGLIFALVYGLIGGLVAALIGGIETIKPVEEITISMSHELRWKILRSLCQWLMVGLMVGLIIGPIIGRIVGLMVGLMVGLIYGLIKGLKADIKTRIKPNQGIKNSVKNMVIISGITLIIALPFKFIIEYFLANIVDSKNLPSIIGLFLATLIWPIFSQAGGDAFSQHIALRFVLAWNRYAPLRYDLLLNYCTERLLLQRVGGRYRFMHKLLQDHFAQMDLE